MTDIFISYARADAAVADRLAAALERDGLDVWIDRGDLEEGRAYDRQIEEALHAAKCVVVLWSARSVGSDWVRAEATEGAETGRLIPVRIEQVKPPLQFLNLQTIDLWSWNGTPEDASYRQLSNALRRRIAGNSATVPSSEMGAMPLLSSPRRWLERVGLAFESAATERRFSVFFIEHFHRQLQFALGLFVALYLVITVMDVMDLYGSPSSNRFRFIVVLPLLATLTALTFMGAAKRYWRLFSLVSALVAIGVILLAMRTVRFETIYLHDGSMIGAVLAMLIGGVAVIPLRTPEAAVVAALPLVANAWMETIFEAVAYDRMLMGQIVGAAWVITVAAAWWRERHARQWFGERPR